MSSDEFVLEIMCGGEIVDSTTVPRGQQLTIGRGTESDVVLPDPHLSRKHLVFSAGDDGTLRVCDLGSKNRSELNGRPFADAILAVGDVIAAGNCRFLVTGPAARSSNVGEARSTISFRDDAGKAPSTKFQVDSQNRSGFVSSQNASSTGRQELEAIYRLAESVVGSVSRSSIGDEVEQALVKTLKFDRFFLGLGDPDQDTFVIERARGTAPDDDRVRMSRSILEKVTHERNAVLIEDASGQVESHTDSIQALGIASFMCAPMLAQEEFVGVVYVDRGEKLACFEESDLQFLQGVAHLAALALADLSLREKIEQDNVRLRGVIARKQGFIAKCEPMLEALSRVDRYAEHSNPVLILGETGTGKKRLARMLHDGSNSCEGPFEVLNCALSTAEETSQALFGVEASGSFPAKKSAFDRAKGGSLYLDSVGDLPVDLQARLLLRLQQQPVDAVPDVRLISAAHQNMKKLRGAGKFRDDLYYRLAALTIDVPKLAKRGSDVVLIAESMLGDAARLSSGAKEVLHGYSWPGNLPELSNAVEHALRHRASEEIEAEDFPPEIVKESRRSPIKVQVDTLKDMEAKHIALALDAAEGNKMRAAELLGISRNTLYQKLQQYGL